MFLGIKNRPARADQFKMQPSAKKSLAEIYSFQLRLMLAVAAVVAAGLLVAFLLGDLSSAESARQLGR